MAPRKILIFGTGSLGSIYAFFLASAKCHITCVCRSNYPTIKADGIKIDSTLFGCHDFRPDVVTSETPQDQYDYVIVTSKSFPTSNVAELLVPAVTPGHTTIVLIQNGIDIEGPYREKFPDNAILSCVAYLPVTQISPGVFIHKEVERLVLGTYPSRAPQTHKSKAQEFSDLLKAGGATSEVKDDIQGERWQKLLVNAPWNTICALTRSRDAEFLSSYGPQIQNPTLEVIEGVMKEISLLAIASGYPQIGEKKIEFQLSRAKARVTGEENQGVEPSMLADALNGRKMEVDVIVGNVVKIAEKLGLGDKIPMLKMLWVLAAALNCSPRR